MSNTTFQQHKAWDLPVRIFHWVNFTAIICLIFMGMIMLFKKELGITGIDAKVGLKEVHVIIGYVFVLNLIWRIVWGFIGNRFARWSNIMPAKGFTSVVKDYNHSVKSGDTDQYIGHNPMGRLAITFIYLLLLTMAVSGLVRAGTDKEKIANLKAFKGPFGKVHLYGSYVLMFMIVLHIFFVVRVEIKEGGGLVTAMITGKKVLTKKPVDLE